MPNSEITNVEYLPLGQQVRGKHFSVPGKAFPWSLPKFGRVVAVFSQRVGIRPRLSFPGHWRKMQGVPATGDVCR